jgi:site-specific DNA-methyltransferase (adenine-specific)
MSELEDGEVQTIFTSPPYWNKRTYTEGGGLGNEKTPAEYVNKLVSHLGDCKRVLSKSGSFYLNLGDTYKNGDLQNIPHRVLLELKDKYGWIQRNTIIWKKSNYMPSSSKVNLTPTYEYIYHLVKSKDYYYHPTPTKSKSTKPDTILNKSKDGKYDHKSVSPYIPNELKNLGDYWSEDVVETAVANQSLDLPNNKIHIARFSEKIVLLPILQTSKEGDLVLDPFMGSGTTGRVCDIIKRNFVGYDINNYLE